MDIVDLGYQQHRTMEDLRHKAIPLWRPQKEVPNQQKVVLKLGEPNRKAAALPAQSNAAPRQHTSNASGAGTSSSSSSSSSTGNSTTQPRTGAKTLRELATERYKPTNNPVQPNKRR
jgi:ribosome assembly protein YihI (activator of Der GTPase)